ncbi:alpha/beta fold hydrolase [Bacillus pseudomycoides]|uniref:alpha/beta fold hydrolase n=1 Tax=Bacillus pseudomycoides TaxID=64104 RepID=UPI000BF13CFB|nr:alpha/beta hydrolase [Bacillus pseudomycoides]PEJ27678.1 alpha/beta hydrolase [Bacillus pseudomycoides]PGE92827.1 alpha/beta hydrolase [Bacillus pseudomycoides]PHA83197.1 alpha/beta hydrolase [Bacillus pseudomycoides]PHC66383.1 alpha/beta hydrolase [Bacillus pseudomycoides]
MNLHFEVKGIGRPVIFLHSGAMDSRDWQFIAPQIAEKSFQVITLDLRGAGKSPVPTEPIDYVKDLRSIYDQLDMKEAVLVGHSLGGQIATDFTLTYPNKVSKLILIAPGLSGYQFSSEYRALERRASSAIPDVEKMINITLSESSWRIPKGPTNQLLRQIMRDNILFTWGTHEVVSYSAIERLHEIDVSTLLLIGDNELDDLFQIAERYKAVPDIRVVHITNANHIMTLTHPEEISKHITDFLN